MGGKKNIAGLAVAGVVVLALLALLIYVFMQSWIAGLVLLGGLLVVGFILLVFVAILAAKKKQKEAAFEEELAASASGAGGVSGAAAKARVDELRRRFQEGVETFRKHGKSPYSVPWYVIVGEPGAGKTEAIRHSMIGFPPGLQDELQGSGGTLNMDWWFSNHAVILDTAGRMLFEEAGGKSSQEWREFLKLLTKARPNCPLNGVMLCIPADSLIKDSIDEVDTKAANIASKLSLIQRELDVRFPVFVVVTKADLINGFREFFDSVDDPQLQHQMVGWSNPAPLDEPFRADEVEDHLLDMQDRLVKRRMGLMYDPAAREGGARVDEVDAMYAFPEALVNLAPNLERYLETIFKGGEWAQQPLFARGIYFASAMQEGSALDADLAKSLGVPVENLEGGMWERQRSYFLRDLFIEKMFRERGLVTRASNAMKLKAKRRLAMRVFVAAAAVVLMALTWFGYRSLKKSIGDQKAFWASAAERFGRDPVRDQNYPVLVGGFTGPQANDQLQYHGGKKVGGMGDAKTLAESFDAAYEASRERIKVSPVFFIASMLAPDSTAGNLFSTKRERAAQVVFTRGALQPLAGRALEALKDRDSFGDREVDALAQLIRVYRSTEEDPPETDWAKLGAFVLRDEPRNLSETAIDDEQFGAAGLLADAEPIQKAFDKLVAIDDNDAWPRNALQAISGGRVERTLRQVTDKVTRGVANSFESGGGDTGAMAELLAFQRALDRYDEIEVALLNAYAPAGGGGPTQTRPKFWADRVPQLEALEGKLDELSRELGERTYDAWYAEKVAEAAAGERRKLAVLREALGETPREWEAELRLAEELEQDPPEPNDLQKMRDFITDAEAALASAQERAIGDRARLEAMHRNLMAGSLEQGRAFKRRLEIYRDTEGVRTRGVELEKFVDLIVIRGSINDGVQQQKAFNEGVMTGDSGARIDRAALASNAVLDMAADARTIELFGKAENLSDLPTSVGALKQTVRSAAERRGFESAAIPTLPLMTITAPGGTLDSTYEPRAAREVIEVVGEIERRTGNSGKAEQLKRARDDYAGDYILYWKELFEGTATATFADLDTWPAFKEGIREILPAQVNNELAELLDRRVNALAELPLTGSELQWSTTLESRRDEAMDALSEMISSLESGVGELSLEAWRGLPSDAAQAKESLLRESQQRFEGNFIAPVGRGGKMSVDYWGELSKRGVRSLSVAGATAAAQARTRLLNDWRRFPLLPLRGGANVASIPNAMSPTEVDRANADAGLIGAAGGGGAGSSGGYAATDVGSPNYAPPGAGDVANWLDAMRGEQVSPDAMRYLQSVTSVLNGISGQPQMVKIRWKAGGSFIGNIRIDQGGAALTPGENTFEDADLGEFAMPGAGIDIRVWRGDAQRFEAPGAEEKQTISIGGPWAAMAMIQAWNGQSTDGTTWTVQIEGDRRFRGTLELEFARKLPLRDNWPKP